MRASKSLRLSFIGYAAVGRTRFSNCVSLHQLKPECVRVCGIMERTGVSILGSLRAGDCVRASKLVAGYYEAEYCARFPDGMLLLRR